METATKVKRKMHKCHGCNEKMSRMGRDLFTKYVLFWLPLRRYYCKKCLRTKYVFSGN